MSDLYLSNGEYHQDVDDEIVGEIQKLRAELAAAKAEATAAKIKCEELQDEMAHRWMPENERLRALCLRNMLCPSCGSHEPHLCGHNPEYSDGYEIGMES